MAHGVNNFKRHYEVISRFLGAFTKFRKNEFISLCPSAVCLFIRMEQLGSHWTEFDET